MTEPPLHASWNAQKLNADIFQENFLPPSLMVGSVTFSAVFFIVSFFWMFRAYDPGSGSWLDLQLNLTSTLIQFPPKYINHCTEDVSFLFQPAPNKIQKCLVIFQHRTNRDKGDQSHLICSIFDCVKVWCNFNEEDLSHLQLISDSSLHVSLIN